MFSFDLLCVLFTYGMLLGEELSLVGAPIIGIKTCNTKWHKELFQLYKHCICVRSQYISQDRTTVMVNRMP